jgi:hypothetical protein
LPNRQAVALKECQLARHKESRSKDQEVVSQCFQFANITIRQCKNGCKKEEKRKEKRIKEKERRKKKRIYDQTHLKAFEAK